MKKAVFILFIVLSVGLMVSFESGKTVSAMSVDKLFQDSLEADRAKYIKLVSDAIKGKEKMRVDSVFQNLKVLGGFPAENLLLAMNSWSKALGVTCNHCHDTDNWALDSKAEKGIAREMSVMSTKINSEFLAKIRNLKSIRPIINCTSCHNGKLKPALRITE